MQIFLARLAPFMLDRIAYGRGLTEHADKLAAAVAFCLSHGMTKTDLRVRYPEIGSCARCRSLHRQQPPVGVYALS